MCVNPEDFGHIQSYGGDPVQPYSVAVEQSMITFYSSLREKDQRRYAAVEAEKLGHGGIEYLAYLMVPSSPDRPFSRRRHEQSPHGFGPITSPSRSGPPLPPARASRSSPRM